MHSERPSQKVGCWCMTAAAQYREFARECARLANELTNEQHRAALKEMEEAWAKLAKEAEKNERQ